MTKAHPNSIIHDPDTGFSFYLSLLDGDFEKQRKELVQELNKIKKDLHPNDSTADRYGNVRLLTEIYEEAIAGDNHSINLVAHQMYYNNKPANKKWLAKFVLSVAANIKSEMVYPVSLFYLAKIYIYERDVENALAQLKYLEGLEFAPALALMGRLYYKGDFLEKNENLAIHMWSTAGELGHLLSYVFESKAKFKQKKGIPKLKGQISHVGRIIKAIILSIRMNDYEKEYAILI